MKNTRIDNTTGYKKQEITDNYSSVDLKTVSRNEQTCNQS